LEVQEANGEVEVVYPSTSILAQPYVAWVDKNVEHKGTADVAKAYLEFLYTPEGQEIIAKNFYRPNDPAVLAKYAAQLQDIKRIDITTFAKSWYDASAKYFSYGGVFDSFYKPK